MVNLRNKRIVLAIILFLFLFPAILIFASWLYTSTHLSFARSRGVYPSAEEAMVARIEKRYVGLSSIDIIYAGPNSFNGSRPHVWYIIAEVRAASRADGSHLGHHGCDAPGSYFLQIKEGWVHIPEGAFPELLGFWLSMSGQAGPGQSIPSTDWAPSQPARFCQST